MKTFFCVLVIAAGLATAFASDSEDRLHAGRLAKWEQGIAGAEREWKTVAALRKQKSDAGTLTELEDAKLLLAMANLEKAAYAFRTERAEYLFERQESRHRTEILSNNAAMQEHLSQARRDGMESAYDQQAQEQQDELEKMNRNLRTIKARQQQAIQLQLLNNQ